MFRIVRTYDVPKHTSRKSDFDLIFPVLNGMTLTHDEYLLFFNHFRKFRSFNTLVLTQNLTVKTPLVLPPNFRVVLNV